MPSKKQEIKLTIELVPKTCWFSNVRDHVSVAQWDTIRKQVYVKANYFCQICGSRGTKWPVECHEVWDYDDKKHIHERTLLSVTVCYAILLSEVESSCFMMVIYP